MKRQSLQEYFAERKALSFEKKLYDCLELSDITLFKKYYKFVKSSEIWYTKEIDIYIDSYNLEPFVGMPCIEVIHYLDATIARGH